MKAHVNGAGAGDVQAQIRLLGGRGPPTGCAVGSGLEDPPARHRVLRTAGNRCGSHIQHQAAGAQVTPTLEGGGHIQDAQMQAILQTVHAQLAGIVQTPAQWLVHRTAHRRHPLDQVHVEQEAPQGGLHLRGVPREPVHHQLLPPVPLPGPVCRVSVLAGRDEEAASAVAARRVVLDQGFPPGRMHVHLARPLPAQPLVEIGQPLGRLVAVQEAQIEPGRLASHGGPSGVDGQGHGVGGRPEPVPAVDHRLRSDQAGQRLPPAPDIVEHPTHELVQVPAPAVGRVHPDRAHAAHAEQSTLPPEPGRNGQIHAVDAAIADEPVAFDHHPRPLRLEARGSPDDPRLLLGPGRVEEGNPQGPHESRGLCRHYLPYQRPAHDSSVPGASDGRP